MRQMMTHDEMIAVIRAHASGAIIEGRNLSDAAEWQPIAISSFARFNFGLTEYRIKPEPPKLREWILELHEERVIGSDGYSTIRHSATQETHRHQGKNFVHVREVLPDEEGKA